MSKSGFEGEKLGPSAFDRRMFQAAYPGVRFNKMTFAHASNAIAGFLIEKFKVTHTPWDQFHEGDDEAVSEAELVGARDFMSLRCSICHGGPAFTDNEFHNVAVAQFGPGTGGGAGFNDDFGRMNVTGDPLSRYAFRTPGLRNVVLTAPYGHDGAFHSLREFIAHYSDSHDKLRSFDPNGLEPMLRGTMLANAEEILLTRDTLLNGVVIPDSIVDHLTTFMGALTEPPRRLWGVMPRKVPSGLPVDRD